MRVVVDAPADIVGDPSGRIPPSQSGSAVASVSSTLPSGSSASADLVDSSVAVTAAASGSEAELGRLSMFATSREMLGWIPAGGRVLPRNSQLGGLLQSSGFVLNGEVRAPSLGDVGAFSWAIAKDGAYPMLD
jgi:hypothetical protein